ncbi:hypothetical protein R3W88_019365 [Solanum pinnatisectum]|uniref:Uncharacterized protein n=1 Tax=Solanum pinnatisectum TaxID=50273 RepID=A0AAV9KKN8_9SOLN|nr:hypothetical protein R3W88_019365 [Solanum pinnatisectum]
MGWKDMCKTTESAKQYFSCSMVLWMKPNFGWVKLNFDGCFKGNSGCSDGSGIIKDHNGNVLMAYTDFYSYCNYLSNIGERKKMFMKFNNVDSLPSMVKVLIDMDREGTPNFRVRPKRNQFVINHG